MSDNKLTKAFLIDPVAKELKAVELNLGGDEGFKEISKAIDCEFFNCVTLARRKDGNSETLYCDDVGLLDESKFEGVLHALYGPVFGKCLIMGTNQEGESVDTLVETADDLMEMNILCYIDRKAIAKPFFKKE